MSTSDELLRKQQEEAAMFDMYLVTLDRIAENMNTMSVSEIREFESLYQNPPNSDDPNFESIMRHRHHLSEKFRSRINIFADIKIVDDNDHTKIIGVLPKIFSKIEPIRDDLVSACSNFDYYLQQNDRPDIRKNATDEFIASIAISQNLTLDKKQKAIEETKIKRIQAEQVFLGKQENGQVEQEVKVREDTPITVAVDFDFDLE